jgi:small subunit ribosomal protein S8
MDKIADMLVMVKNANIAGKEGVVTPYSKYKHAIAECLVKNGFLKAAHKKTGKDGFPALELELVYKGKEPKVSHVERVSRPSRRIYFGTNDIRSVRNGYGLLVLSTPKGVLDGKSARKEQVGGEALFKIW